MLQAAGLKMQLRIKYPYPPKYIWSTVNISLLKGPLRVDIVVPLWPSVVPKKSLVRNPPAHTNKNVREGLCHSSGQGL